MFDKSSCFEKHADKMGLLLKMSASNEDIVWGQISYHVACCHLS